MFGNWQGWLIAVVLIAVAAISLWRTFGETVQENITHSTSEVGGLH